MRNSFILFLIMVLPFNLMGQEGLCGTQVNEAQVNLESLINLPSSKATEGLTYLNTTLSVTVYVIKNQEGQEGITSAAIQSAIDRLNNAFVPIKLNFRICNTIHVENYQFDKLSAIKNENDLFTQYSSPNTINLYIASELLDKTGIAVSGYTFMPVEGKDAIFMDKDFVATNDIVHQFGHFFNLYHTHETIFGKELVKGTNSKVAGDKCSDTPADPGITSLIDNKCDYTGTFQDADKQFYVPSTNNYMSLGNESCRCVFSHDQLNRVIYSVQNHKKHLW